jgi:hypothetical protein
MFADLTAMLRRAAPTLAEDAAGVLALFALLIGGLSVPVL